MADTTFINQKTVVQAAWTQDVNDAIYRIFSQNGQVPSNPALAPGIKVPLALGSIAALRNLTQATAPAYVQVIGYRTIGDGGGGFYSVNASDVSSADNGGSIIVDTSGRRWYLQTNGGQVSAEQFGAYGNWNGSTGTDDTAAIQAALNSFGLSGGTVVLSKRYSVGNLTVPQNCSLQGRLLNPEQTIESSAQNYYSWGSQLACQAGTTITLTQGAVVDSVLVIEQGLSLPATTNAQATTLLTQFAGTAFTVTGIGCHIRNSLILGFNQGVTVGADGGNQGRFNMTNVRGDCNNGVVITGAEDICRLEGVHFWPFLTVDIPSVSNANLARPGTAFDIEGPAGSWSQLISCFGYGYNTTYLVNGDSNIHFLGCQSDTSASAYTAYGWNIEGSSSYTHLDGCMQNGAAICLNINSSGTYPEVRTSNCNWNAGTTCINLQTGRLQSVNDSFHSGSVGVAFGAGTAPGSSLVAPYFINVPTPWNYANGTVSQTSTVLAPSYGNGPSPNVSIIQGGLQITYNQTEAVGAGPAITLSGPYNSYTGVYSTISAQLVSGTTGSESSNLILANYKSGALVNRWSLDNSGAWWPVTDNSVNLGGPSNRPTTIYAVNGSINTSDRNHKTEIQDIPDFLLDMIDEVPKRMFHLEGQDKWSVGVVAQDVEEWLRKNGYDPVDFSFWTCDETSDGGTIQGLNYAQIAVLEAAALRRKVDKS